MEKKEEGNKREPQVLFGGKFEKEEEEVESEKEEEESEENVEVEEEDEEESETEEDESEAEEEETWSDFDTRHDDLNHRDMMARKNLELAKSGKQRKTKMRRKLEGLEKQVERKMKMELISRMMKMWKHMELVILSSSPSSNGGSGDSGGGGVCGGVSLGGDGVCGGVSFGVEGSSKILTITILPVFLMMDLCIVEQANRRSASDVTKMVIGSKIAPEIHFTPPKCYGVRRALLTSRTEKTYGQKFLKCRQCEGFQWLKDAKMEANGDSVRGKTVVKYTVEVNVDDISNGFETKLVINIPK
ncbi:hypothetical protein IFM89_024871 [Coptis chinensis]|uniref:Uncharacterized protein n=1 Tax=Coptis chinensis TaxID=261450 RepID=A0A835HPC8_9MAGN|nr:hypothetical protein IFM89_024871 [Coptis chinensis]